MTFPKVEGGSKVRRRVRRDTSVHIRPIFPGLARIRSFLSQLTLDSGNPFLLEKFQDTYLGPYSQGQPETVVILPTGNAKSTGMGGVGLEHMDRVEEPEVVIAAASADQAENIFGQAAGLVYRSRLSERFDVKRGIKTIYFKGAPSMRPPGRMRVISADVDRNDGVIPTLALIDELHRHRDGGIYGLFRNRLNKRGGQMITISTAGFGTRSPLAQLRENAHNHPSFQREGMLNTAVLGPLAYFEWCLGEGDDPRHIPTVKRANPLKHITEADLRTRLDSIDQGIGTWAEWLRFTCGIWTHAEHPWIDPTVWEALRWDVGTVDEGEEVTVAVRVGVDAGIGIAALRDDGRVAITAERVPAPPDGRVSLESVEFALRRLNHRYRVREVCYDRDQFERSADLLRRDGLPMSEEPQSAKRLATATQTFWRLVSGALLGHDGDGVLRDQVLAGVTKETTQGWHLVPTAQTSCLIAVAMAAHVATRTDPAPPEFIAL